MILKIVFVIVIAAQVCARDKRISSAYGKEFFTGFMRNIGGSYSATLRLVIGTPGPQEKNVEFVVETSDLLIYEGNINSSTIAKVNIPRNLQTIASDMENRWKGIHVYTVSQNDEIFVLVENFYYTINYGSFLAYPNGFEAIQENSTFEYRIISKGDILHSEFLLVGCYNNTLVEIIPSQSVTLPINLWAQNDSDVVEVHPGTSYHVLIQQMQTLLVLSVPDLTGTTIISSKPLTVISGHECARVPSSVPGCEHFAVQVPPTSTWGSTFLLVPFAGRIGPQTFKAIGSVNNATFSYICNADMQYIQGPIFELNTSHYCYLESSKPAFVVQFSTGHDLDNRGDPAIAMISPVENYLHKTKLILLPFPTNYISVTTSAEHFNRNSILLDGMILDCAWHTFYNFGGNTVGYGCSAYVNSSENHTQHTVIHSRQDGRLSVLVYGFKFTNAINEGYAYLAGMSYHYHLPMSNSVTETVKEVTMTAMAADIDLLFTEEIITTGSEDALFPLKYVLSAGIAVPVVGFLLLCLIGLLCCHHKRSTRKRQQVDNIIYYEELSFVTLNKDQKVVQESLSMEPCNAHESLEVMQPCPAYHGMPESLSMEPCAAYESLEVMQPCPAYHGVSDSLSMEPCAAYERLQVVQPCPAYQVVSDCSQKDQMLQEVSRNAQGENGTG